LRYNLWRNRIRVCEVIIDKPLVKGDIIQHDWRVVDAAWQADARDPTNSVSSGDVLVEPVTINGAKAAFELEFTDFKALYDKTPEPRLKDPKTILREANVKIIARFEEDILDFLVRDNGGERESWRHTARGHIDEPVYARIGKALAPTRAIYLRLHGSSTSEAEITRILGLPFACVERHFS
jgi:hypothetical protein